MPTSVTWNETTMDIAGSKMHLTRGGSGRPLLILHGTSDTNVPYLQSIRLLDELLRHGKGGLVSFMTYPGEFHYYASEHVLRDVWHRVADFFDTHLKGRA